LDEQRHEEALQAWRNATALQPQHVSAWSNAIILLDNLNRYDSAISLATEALRHNPSEASLHYNLANALGKAGQYKESERHFLTAIELRQQPGIAMYYSNLGEGKKL